MNRTLILCGAMSVAAAACGGEATTPVEQTPAFEQQSNEIVGGKTTSAFPGVGALSSPDFGGPFCTATLIAPKTVVTAAHCLDDLDFSKVTFVGGTNAERPTWSVKADGGVQHSSWKGQGQGDIAIVWLQDEPPVEVLPYNTALPSDVVGRSMRFVGYGVSNGAMQTGAGTKREVTIAISETSATEFAYADPRKNTCNGDSGGPAFIQLNGQWEVAGVTSRGDRNCTKYGIDTRVDAYEAFISANLR